jgi:hypothetical protein
MARLILIHESGVTGEFELKPGVNTVGRNPDNDLSIDHESVSGHHCEIEVTASGIVVRDLDSNQGTWIDTAQIREARLGPGQTLQVGEVQFALQTSVRVGGKTGPTPGAAVRIASPAALGAGNSEPAMTFVGWVAEAFSYPFRGHGVWMLLSGALALMLTYYAALLARYAFVFGLLALIILTIGVIGYFFAFIKEVTATSAGGAKSLPGWPEIASPADFLTPFFHCLGLLVVSFGPWLLWRIWGLDFGEAWMPWALAALGAFYAPMALVGLAMADSLAGLNPAVIVPSILRIFGHYCVAVVLVVILLGVQFLGGWLADALPIPLVTPFAVQFLTLYLLVVTARILGAMYYLHREDLGWFR